ncbi:antibiotic biosynthesis monooxygenase [Natronomonas gomsonensis]|uniref:putative quinol monooxygenase n=1 Tax=Natronomonas gomsonensis TaxID=1046043 RepID=UPI0020CA8DB8|nr:putative quinol monooxygenase [Natronomonas gomsonensis]MCY4730555.1 antibiotic biosynthesis monooxygenase [Natronomonas gomsonensis]
MIVLHASFPIQGEKLDEALELADNLVDESNQEPGMIDYRATQDIQDETVIRFFEQYEDGEAFESHTQTDHFQEFEEELGDLLAGEPEILRFDVAEASELEL